jgi:hypothetical protein
MSTFVPRGYVLLTDLRTADNMDTWRGRFAAGESKPLEIRADGTLDEISQSEWISEIGGTMMGGGRRMERTHNGWQPGGPIVVPIAEKAAVMPTEAARDRRGRKGYNWDPFWHEVVLIADLDGLPETQAELETTMSKWCEKTWGKEPAQSTVRERLSPIYAAKRKGRK